MSQHYICADDFLDGAENFLDESDDDDDAPQEKGFTKITIADEDSSDEEVVEINQSGGFELPSPTEDDVLRKFETMDADELIVEEVPVAGTKVAIDDDDSVEEVPVKTGGTKVAIEDSSEDEENLLVAETVPESLKPDPPSQGVKVAIEDDEDDDAQSYLLCCCVVLRSVVRAMRLAPWCRWRRQRDVVCTARARRRRERNGQVTEKRIRALMNLSG